VEPYSLDKLPDELSHRGRPSASNKKAVQKTFGSKIFASHEFGYRRITVERPLRLSVQFSDDKIETLRFASGPANGVMQKVYALYGQHWTEADYGHLADVRTEIRTLIKAGFNTLKERQVKDLLSPKTWRVQKKLLEKAVQIQAVIGTKQSDDFNVFEGRLSTVLKQCGIKLEARERKQLIAAVCWTNPQAAPVIKKVLKHRNAADALGPTYGVFTYQGQRVTFQPDSNLRDNEDVPLTAETARGANVDAVNEAYFMAEVAPHVGDAWIDAGKRDLRDEQIGIVGYEIPFNRHFYQYEPPRDLAEIDADLDVLSAEIMEMLREVRS